MNVFKTNLLILLCLIVSEKISAQEGTVQVEKDPRIDQLLKVYNNVNKKAEYYQIQVGFRGKNSEAQRLLSQVEVDFPGWYSTIDFQEPTYRVKVGKFKTRLEAEKRYIEVRKKYPNAMLLKPESSFR